GAEKVCVMARHDSRTVQGALETVVVHTAAVDIAGEHGIPVRCGPVIREIDHGTDVGMPASEHAVLAAALARVLPASTRPMEVIGTRSHQFVSERIEVITVHALKARSRDHAEEMWDHAVGNECLAIVVEVESPWVGGAVGHGLEGFA